MERLVANFLSMFFLPVRPCLVRSFCRQHGGRDCSPRVPPEVTAEVTRILSNLVLGDNRANSADSVMGCRGRGTGPCEARFVHADRVVGTLGWRWWPLPPGGAERD